MAIEQCKNIENGDNNGLEDLENPFIEIKKVVDSEDDESGISGENGSIGMVLLSTAIAICGSFEFGSRVSISNASIDSTSSVLQFKKLILLPVISSSSSSWSGTAKKKSLFCRLAIQHPLNLL